MGSRVAESQNEAPDGRPEAETSRMTSYYNRTRNTIEMPIYATLRYANAASYFANTSRGGREKSWRTRS